MMFILYDLVFIVFSVFYLPFFILRLQNAESAERLIKDRLGFLSPEFKADPQKKRIWLHAVSVGEVIATKKLVKELLARYPEAILYFSTVTPTGNGVAKKLFGDQVKLFYFPFDVSWITNRVIQTISPNLILLMETEIWPNLILSAKKHKIPVGILNGRFSPKSFRSYYRFKGLIQPITSLIRFASVQNESFKRRFIRLGFNKEKVFVTGTMKYDVFEEPTGNLISREAWKEEVGFPEDSKVWIAASTHPQEEATCIRIFQKLRVRFPNLHLVIAPRHIERTKQIIPMIQQLGFSFSQASQIKREKPETADVFVLDTLGQLATSYFYADYVFMGGSLVSRGGQNPIEAIFWKKPVAFGPETFNFKDVYATLEGVKGGIRIQDEESLLQAINIWLCHPEKAEAMGKTAYETLVSLKGASLRNCELIEKELTV